MTHPSPSRRAVFSGIVTALAAPALISRRAEAATGFGAAIDRARGLDQLNALVIAEDGTVVVAEAFRGLPPDRPVNVKSVSKTIVAALTGIAIDTGHLPGTAATLGEIAPDLIPRGADPRVAGISVADLLTMQAGLERTSGGNYGDWVSSRDWVADALSRPFVAEPGSRMLYSTGSYHVLGAVLAEVTGQSLLSLARDRLGQPLGIEIPAWTRDPQGRYMGGNEMALSPLAMIRFGEAFRRGGEYDGTHIVSADWVRQSFTPRTRSAFSRHDYGYGWFLLRAGGHDVAYARGYGGQMLYVVPSLGLTVAITSDATRPARSEGHAGDLNRLLADLILPAAGTSL
jgi:CubicO group peptidase (beta-lactamase class C family)